MTESFTTLDLTEDQGVARVTFNNPPINLFDPLMISDFRRVLDRLSISPDIRVVIFTSANPDFFIGHADLNLFLDPHEHVPPKPTKLGSLQTLFEDLRTLPQATISIVEGRASGAGTELLTSCDMAFAAQGRAVLSQFEVAVGVLPGATGSQRLPRLLGRSRALEMILGCDEFDADLAEKYGLVNRALPANEIRGFVDRLARRIASFPGPAIALNKVAVDASELPIQQGLLEETHVLHQTLVSGEAQRRMRLLLELGAQDATFERDHFTSALEQLGV